MSECGFCQIVAGMARGHMVLDDAGVLAFLDTRPLFKGHILVVPRDHHETLADLPGPLVEPLFSWVKRLAAVLPDALGAAGTFVAINNKISQSVPHLHVHVVPRTKGDGLRGFFWPRTRYADDAEAGDFADRIARALAAEG